MKFREPGAGTGAKNLVKLKAGESVRGVFRGDPYDFRMHWVGNRSALCTGEAGDGCQHCKEGLKSSFRFRLNFIVNENGAYVAKVFEQGWTTYEALRALHEGDYDLEKHLMKITRHGTGTDTTYSIIPVPNGGLSKEQDAQIAKVPLNPLSMGGSEAVETADSDDEDIPF